MERNLSPRVLSVLKIFEKNDDSRKSAMKELKYYVKDLDSNAIPLFVAQVSDAKETGLSSGEYAISLYEVLARAHGPKVVPYIDNIMETIIKNLTLSAEFSSLHHACSKVVMAIVRYGIGPTTPEDKKKHVIHSLCKPLSDSLLVGHENLSSGAAFCLKALVELDNWRFASHQIVNKVCQRVVGALEKNTHITSHMGLVMALARHNSLIVEAYARLLIHSGLQILNDGVDKENLQRRMLAIQMVDLLMKSLDPRSICSEIGLITEEMEKCQSDMMANVKVAAFKALQTARKIIDGKGSKIEDDIDSITRSNCSRRDTKQRRKLWGAGGDSHLNLTVSPESHPVDLFADYDSVIESPMSLSQASWDSKRSANQELWNRYEDNSVDVSIRGEFFPKKTHKSAIESCEHDEYFDDEVDHADEFAGLLQGNSENRVARNSCPSCQSSCHHINADDAKILTTPRKLIQSVRSQNDVNSYYYNEQTRGFQSPSMSRHVQSPKSNYVQRDISYDVNLQIRRDEPILVGLEQCHGSIKCVSSTEDISPGTDLLVSEKFSRSKSQNNKHEVKKHHSISAFTLICGLFVVLIALLASSLWIDEHNEAYTVIPT